MGSISMNIHEMISDLRKQRELRMAAGWIGVGRRYTLVMSRFLATFFVLSGIAMSASYEVRPDQDTHVSLSVEKTGLMRGRKHLFVFEKYGGTLRFDPQQPDGAAIQLTIDSRSAICRDEWVSQKDLQKIQATALEDMLAVNRYPSMTFTSSSIKALGGNRFEAHGTLTIRDIAKPVIVTAQLNAADPARLRVSGAAIIRLTDYKLKPPSAVLGAIGTKDEMTLNFTISASRID